MHFELIIWIKEGKALRVSESVFFFFLGFLGFFFTLGAVSFSLDTHYKVNNNFVLGHSGKTLGCPQALA